MDDLAAAKDHETGPAGGDPVEPPRERWWSKRLWLPRPVYESLPAVYVLLGIGALSSALYMPGWTWILPYLVLLAIACIHAGIVVSAMRFRRRRARKAEAQLAEAPVVCENSPPYDSQ